MDQQPPGDHRAAAGSGVPTPTCYRHPDRETGISCTRCGRPICPECMVSASVGFQCPDCVRQGSGTGHHPAAARPRTLAGGAVAADPRLVTKILLGVNLAVFLLVSLRPALVNDLTLLGRWDPAPMLVPGAGVAEGQWYRLLTSMFLHQEMVHIAFNMLGLWWLGGQLEAALGRLRFSALYLLSGLAGSALTYLLAAPGQQSLGASGAVYGLFGAAAVLMRRMNYDMRPVLVLLALNLAFTFFNRDGIAWEAHVGGLIAGVVIAIGMVHAPRERRTAVQVGVCALVLLASAGIIVARTMSLT